MKSWPLLWIVAILICLFLLRLIGNYADCLIAHRSGFQLTTPRAVVHAECKKRLSPFYL